MPLFGWLTGATRFNILKGQRFCVNINKARVAVEGLLDESKHFIELTEVEADIDKAAEPVELRIQLARWQFK